jgi:uncharacterized protein (DUF983 family)
MSTDAKASPRAEVPPLGTRLGRAARLRCPRCGGGGLLAHWLKLKPRCPACGLRLDRGEHDFFLGSMMFNIAIAEGLLALVCVGVIIAAWPRVPWTLLEFGGPAMMVVAPFLFYPFSQTLWLAVDLLIRPLTVEELEWHRTAGEHETRRSDDR